MWNANCEKRVLDPRRQCPQQPANRRADRNGDGLLFQLYDWTGREPVDPARRHRTVLAPGELLGGFQRDCGALMRVRDIDIRRRELLGHTFDREHQSWRAGSVHGDGDNDGTVAGTIVGSCPGLVAAPSRARKSFTGGGNSGRNLCASRGFVDQKTQFCARQIRPSQPVAPGPGCGPRGVRRRGSRRSGPRHAPRHLHDHRDRDGDRLLNNRDSDRAAPVDGSASGGERRKAKN